MNVFQVSDGNFYRRKEIILKNINFSINTGEILSVLGRNGVGKTTLIKCLLGLLKWDSGKSLMFSKPIDKNIWNFVGYIPQNKETHINLKVLDVVMLGLNPVVKLQPNKSHVFQSMEILERLNVAHLCDKSCKNLSGGELQMVTFAMALVKKPRIIILDEPESALDFRNQKIILDILRNLSIKGFNNIPCSIILNTHCPQNAINISHKSILLYKTNDDLRSNCIFGDTKDILTPSSLSKLYGVELDSHCNIIF